MHSHAVIQLCLFLRILSFSCVVRVLFVSFSCVFKCCAGVFCVFFVFQYLVSFSCVFKCCAGVPQIWVSPTCFHPVRKAQIRLSRAALHCFAYMYTYIYSLCINVYVHMYIHTQYVLCIYVYEAHYTCVRVVHPAAWVAESPRQPGKQGHAVFWPTCFSKTALSQLYLSKFERLTVDSLKKLK